MSKSKAKWLDQSKFLATVTINFMYQLGFTMGCPEICSNIIMNVSMSEGVSG